MNVLLEPNSRRKCCGQTPGVLILSARGKPSPWSHVLRPVVSESP